MKHSHQARIKEGRVSSRSIAPLEMETQWTWNTLPCHHLFSTFLLLYFACLNLHLGQFLFRPIWPERREPENHLINIYLRE